MRRFNFFQVFFLTALVPLYLFFSQQSWQQRVELRRATPTGFTFPAAFSRVLAFGFQGILSDYEFLRSATFYGDRTMTEERMSEADWDFLAYTLEVVTDLDPYFQDPYVLGEGLLAWDARRFEQANILLEKGIRARTWDWRLPYYVGFNQFYFQKNYAQGGAYMMKASQVAGSPDFLKTLAARLSYYGGQSKTALLFLQQMLLESKNDKFRVQMQKRLLALQRAVLIEEALQKYRADFNGDPEHIADLVGTGYLKLLPEDPYGGQWGILKNGRVYSTSGFADKH